MIPRQLRDEVGLVPGEVEVSVQGSGLRVEAPAGDSLEETDGRLVIPASGAEITDELVEALRNAGRR